MRVGIIGCGHVSQAHIPHIHRLKGVEIVGVCDTSKEKAQEIAHQFGIRHVYQKASDLLEDRRPDVVHILTPPQTHKELSIQAMEAGCHVLVEKPMALNVKEADEMIAASRHHGVTLGICHNYLFEPAVMEAKELVARGAIGKVVAVEIFWGFSHGWNFVRYRKAQWIYDLPGGFFHENAPHIVYLQMEFLKSLKVVFVTAKRMGNDLPLLLDELRVLFDGELGLGSLSISVSTKPYLRFLSIYGTDMTIQVDLTNNTLVRFRRNRPGKGSKNIDHSLQLLSKTVSNSIQNLWDQRTSGHRILIEKFYKSLLKGTEPPVTGEDGRAVVAVLDQIWAELGRSSPVGRGGE